MNVVPPTGRERVNEGFVGLRLPADLKEKLEKLAAKVDRPLSYYIRQVLEKHVAQKRK
jgi:predicted DNA-binding protein